jgi:predicted nucleotidyltransferase
MPRVLVTYPSLSRADIVKRLKAACIRLEGKLPISRMILFGSYAVGRYTAGSDIDVVVVYKGVKRDDAYKALMDEAGLPKLEPRVYTEEQFATMLAASPRFAEVLAREGIVIVGDESR